jgi:hypothetical protein
LTLGVGRLGENRGC